MSRTDKPRADPKVVAGYLATLAGLAAISWLGSRIARPRPNPLDGRTRGTGRTDA